MNSKSGTSKFYDIGDIKNLIHGYARILTYEVHSFNIIRKRFEP